MRNADLTPRERVKLALGHQETDRVPVDFLATPELWNILRTYLGYTDNESVLKRLGSDIRHPRLPYCGPKLKTHPDGSYEDVWGITWRPVPHKGGIYYEIAQNSLAGILDPGEVSDYPWPDPKWWDMDAVDDQIASWDKDAEYALCFDDFGDPGGFYEIAGYLRGMENLLVDMVERPNLVFEIIEKITDVFTELADRLFLRLGNRIDLIWTSDDIAHQHGLIMSEPMWRDLIFPHHKRFNDRIHESGGCVMYHCCGSVIDAIPGLIEMEIDVLDVLQFSADRMVPEEIKAAYGDALSFHGGADIQHLLPESSEEEVTESISHMVSVMSRGGGYILAPCHAVQIDTPPANLVTLYKTAGSYSRDIYE